MSKRKPTERSASRGFFNALSWITAAPIFTGVIIYKGFKAADDIPRVTIADTVEFADDCCSTVGVFASVGINETAEFIAEGVSDITSGKKRKKRR